MTSKIKEVKFRAIPAMLPGGFATSLENKVAELNNHLAMQGRLMNDPTFVMLNSIQQEMVARGVATFSRVAKEVTDVSVEPAAAKPAIASSTKKKTVAPTVVHETTEDEMVHLLVPGTESNVAPYGLDSEGAALAPYGVKKNGVPKLKRGRKVPKVNIDKNLTDTVVKNFVENESRLSAEEAEPESASVIAEDDEEDEDVDMQDLDNALADLDLSSL